MDYLDRLNKMLNIRFEPMQGLSWQEGVAAVQAKQADMFVSVARTPEREVYTRFTQSYFSMPINIYASNNVSYIGRLENLLGKRVAVVKNYAVHDWIKKDYPNLDLVTVDTPLEGLRQASSGAVDAFVGNRVIASYYIGKEELDKVHIAGDTPYSNEQAMAVRDDWPVFAGILNKAIKAIPPQEHATINNRWMSIRFERETDLTLLWQLLIAFLLIIGFFIFWNRRLTVEIGQRKQAQLALQIAMEKAEAARQTVEDTAEQLRTFRMLTDASGQGIGMAHLDSTISYMNPQLFQMCEVNEKEVENEISFISYYPDWAKEKFESEIMPTILKQGQWTGELELVSSTGRRIPTIENFFVVSDQAGQPLFIADIITDISERKQKERELYVAEMTIESAAEGFFLIEAKSGAIIKVNPSACKLLGYSNEELTDGMHAYDFDMNLTQESWPKFVESIDSSGSMRLESVIKNRNSELIDVEISTQRLVYEGADLLMANLHDITSRAVAIRRLSESEERFQRSLNFAKIGAWDWNIISGEIHWSKQIAPLFGYGEGELETSYDNFINAIHPDDREMLQAAVNASVEQGAPYDLEHRTLCLTAQFAGYRRAGR